MPRWFNAKATAVSSEAGPLIKGLYSGALHATPHSMKSNTSWPMQDIIMLSELRLLYKAPYQVARKLRMCTWSACISFLSSSPKNLMSPLRLRRMKALISRASSKFSWSCNSARLTCQPGLVAVYIFKSCLIVRPLQQNVL